MSTAGTSAAPLRVAIIGSGPSGFYAAEFLTKQENLNIEIDMFDRLPTPYGLVRGGVAPDHPKIKSVTKVYDKTAAHQSFRFYGHVEFGKDITHDELKARYHAIIYAVGAQTDRRMGIPGEDLPGSYAATDFVGWYNAHPAYSHLKFDLATVKRVAVIGNGNVAMDVARILASTYEDLYVTDIADYALEAIRTSTVEDIYILGRRGPAQASFTNPELKELGELSATDVIVKADEIELDPLSKAALAAKPDAVAEANLRTLHSYVERPLSGKPKRLHMRFLVSPVEVRGTDHVEAIKLVKNELYTAPDGSLRPRATDVYEILPVEMVFRSIGYMGVALPGVPFNDRAGIIPNKEGRVIDPTNGQIMPGEYVVGWIKRGPTGVIGTNRPDAKETVTKLVEDVPSFQPLDPVQATRGSVDYLLEQRKVDFVSFDDWQLIDQLEREQGEAIGRPRIKFSRIDEMLEALNEYKRSGELAD